MIVRERVAVGISGGVETAKRIYGAPEFFYYAHPC